jgi:hypothetical protein
MGQHRPASARNQSPANVAQKKARREDKALLREQLGDGDAALKGLAGEPVLDLGLTPVEGGSPAQRDGGSGGRHSAHVCAGGWRPGRVAQWVTELCSPEDQPQ